MGCSVGQILDEKRKNCFFEKLGVPVVQCELAEEVIQSRPYSPVVICVLIRLIRIELSLDLIFY